MAKITIADLSGSAQIEISDPSLAAKSVLTRIRSAESSLVQALGKSVTEPGFEKANAAAAFDPGAIALKGNKLGVKDSINCTLSITRKAHSPLFGDDDYDPLPIVGRECWAAFELHTLLDAKYGAALPEGFGVKFEASAAPVFATYVLVPDAEASATTVREALTKALDRFTILDSAAAVRNLPQGVICASDVAGTVKVSGTWTLPLAVNQLCLADANLPFHVKAAVKPALNVGVAGEVALTSEFSVRFRHSAANVLRVGLYKKRQAEITVKFTASGGVAGDVDGKEVAGPILKAISGGAIDASHLGEDGKAISKALKDNVEHNLAMAVKSCFSDSHFDEAAVIYEVDLTVQKQATDAAIEAALVGDWTGFAHLSNARKTRDVIREGVDQKYTLAVNLLGLYNYTSADEFAHSMKVVVNHENGTVLITDKATAARIGAATSNVGEKIRSATYEGFVATATYSALLAGVGVEAEVSASLDYLLYKDSMDYRAALKGLRAGEQLGVTPVTLRDGLPQTGNPVRHARFAAHSKFASREALGFFFSDVGKMTPRTMEELKAIGRRVLARLLDPVIPVDNQRLVVLNSDALWAAMEKDPANIRPPFYTDWYDVKNWAKAIAKVAPLLADAIAYGKTVAGDPTEDAGFEAKRKALMFALDDATHDTHAAWEHAFPICAMATLAGVKATAGNPVFEAEWNGSTVFSNKPAPAVKTAVSQAQSGMSASR